MLDDETPDRPGRRDREPRHGGPDVSSSWLVRMAPLRAGLVGVVLIVLGVTAEGFGLLVWIGLVAVAVGVGGTMALQRERPR